MTSEQTRQLITDLLYEPSETALLDELESIKTILNPKTPISWLKETLSQELWEEEIFQGGDTPLGGAHRTRQYGIGCHVT
jgi:hypothetical protein